MSQSVDKLVQQGLLTRKTSESSRRTMQLALTAEGAAALDAGNRALAKFTSELTTRMPQELQDQILPALQQLFTDVQGDLDDR
ncbi:transcriptional regulator, MarR family [Streptomyces malaysiensis subsp. malaysiensis]|nr:transcriptional regulator, MarR family [Streptomyces malaysiensis]